MEHGKIHPLHGCVFDATWNIARFIHFMGVCLKPNGISQDSSTSIHGCVFLKWMNLEMFHAVSPCGTSQDSPTSVHGCVFEAMLNIARVIHFNSWMCLKPCGSSQDSSTSAPGHESKAAWNSFSALLPEVQEGKH